MENEINKAVNVLRRLGARRVTLFGSYVEQPENARDVDLAVEGIPIGRLLEADVLVHDILRVPTDLISREESPAFYNLVRQSGKLLYEQG